MCVFLAYKNFYVKSISEEPESVLKIEPITKIENKDNIYIPTLLYHNIIKDNTSSIDGVNITSKTFELHIKGLLDNGFNPISISDYCNYVNGEVELPNNPIIITFDDGYLSNYELAFPILQEYNVPATIFIVTSTVGEDMNGGKVNTPHFTWEHAKEMENSNLIEIHSHSHTHKKMSDLSEEDLEYEMKTSKDLIQSKLNKEEVVFAYPYGGYNDFTLRKGNELGFILQVLVEDNDFRGKYLAVNSDNKLEHFTRVSVDGDMTVEDLLESIKKSIELSEKFT